MSSPNLIFKITPKTDWEAALDSGVYEGAPIDLQDGFIHFSSAEQVAETAAKHFANKTDLLLVAVDAGMLGADLKWEVSRGGALFPHLYSNLSLDSVEWSRPMPLSDQGLHIVPLDPA
ncbi:MAG: DUF952 domain-containing protein [Rhizobiaceae bacterium]|nr:DUF952 domain-containing protein [Rhizobiaceae bacterium]